MRRLSKREREQFVRALLTLGWYRSRKDASHALRAVADVEEAMRTARELASRDQVVTDGRMVGVMAQMGFQARQSWEVAEDKRDEWKKIVRALEVG
jgi:hypothetical protein